jgi:multisubunit Na+/H+ antiporter MnhB subunit
VVKRSVVFQVVARLLLGPSLIAGAALIVKGYADVGDGFAAGVVVSLAVAFCYVAFGATGAERAVPALRHTPWVVVGGLLLGLAVGFFPLALGQPPFSHRPAPGQHVIAVGDLELFTPLGFDVAVFLLVVGVLTVLLHQLADRDRRRTSETAPDSTGHGDSS